MRTTKAVEFGPDDVEKVNVLLASGLGIHDVAARMGLSYEVFRLSMALSDKEIGKRLVDKSENARLASRYNSLFPETSDQA